MYQHPDTLRADIRFREQDCRDHVYKRQGCGLPACPFVATS